MQHTGLLTCSGNGSPGSCIHTHQKNHGVERTQTFFTKTSVLHFLSYLRDIFEDMPLIAQCLGVKLRDIGVRALLLLPRFCLLDKIGIYIGMRLLLRLGLTSIVL